MADIIVDLISERAKHNLKTLRMNSYDITQMIDDYFTNMGFHYQRETQIEEFLTLV